MSLCLSHILYKSKEKERKGERNYFCWGKRISLPLPQIQNNKTTLNQRMGFIVIFPSIQRKKYQHRKRTLIKNITSLQTLIVTLIYLFFTIITVYPVNTSATTSTTSIVQSSHTPSTSVYNRKLVSENVQYLSILKEHSIYHSDKSHVKEFVKGESLAYITPWNSPGMYDIHIIMMFIPCNYSQL